MVGVVAVGTKSGGGVGGSRGDSSGLSSARDPGERAYLNLLGIEVLAAVARHVLAEAKHTEAALCVKVAGRRSDELSGASLLFLS